MQSALLRIPAAAAILCTTSLGFGESDAILQRFLARVRNDLNRLPSLACTQDVERFRRSSTEQQWAKLDALRLEVAAIGDRELYARAGDRRFQTKPLAELVGRGTIGTGQFANFARQIFSANKLTFTFKGETEQDGVAVFEFGFDVPVDQSGYTLRSGTAQAVVAFQGLFMISKATADLIRLEVQAYDIPEKLGIAQADTIVVYERAPIEAEEILLPKLATLSITAMDGVADLNRWRLSSCRQYRADSTVRYEAQDAGDEDRSTPPAAAPAGRRSTALPEHSILELALDAPLDPSVKVVGDAISARLLAPVRDENGGVIIAQGTRVLGRVARLDKHTMPLPVFEIGIEFTKADIPDREIAFAATMIDAGPAAGLIRQSKRLEPTFTRKRTERLDILVREVQQGQGILTWDARRGPLPAGLKMKWRVMTERESGR
jgi:hypothetical protein